VILATGYENAVPDELRGELGVVALLQRPVDSEALLDAIERLFAPGNQWS
jgi:hypothetical protein